MQKLRRIHFQLILASFIAQCLCAGAALSAPSYFDSSEPGCDGSDPNILKCDDFEDGTWIVTNADTDGGVNNPDNDGWGGWIYTPPDPQGTAFARCGGKGVAGTNCAATSGPRGGTSGMMADFDLVGRQSVDEVYVRYYMKLQPGFVWGHEKMLTFNKCCSGNGGIFFGAISSHFGAGNLAFGNTLIEDSWRYQNQGSTLIMRAPSWYYIEVHLKVNTPGQSNGVLEIWADDCGSDGLGCTGQGTLRTRHTNMTVRNDNSQIGTIWLENWGNPRSVGETYYDQFVVSKQRVGPMGVTIDPNPTPPPVPTAVAPPTWVD